MENPSNFEEINWLRLDDYRPPKKKEWFRVIESNGTELLQKCTKLEDVENILQEKRNEPKYRYNKEQLLKLRTHPLSLKSPTLCVNLKFLCGKNATKSKDKDEFDLKKTSLKKHGVLRPFDQINEKHDLKKNEIGRNHEKSSSTFRTDKIDERKPTDPASRLRKEQDICLSPQRKSFNTGCYVPNTKNETIVINNSSSKHNSENNVSGNRENREVKENRNIREVPRRIGSGRIITSDPQFVIRGYPESRQVPKEKSTTVYKYTSQGKSVDKEKEGFWERHKNVGYYDKRKYQYNDHHYDSEELRERAWDQQRNNNYYERRRHCNSEYQREDDEEKEPEWMKDGPGSKNDMIELKGFNENIEKFFRSGRNKSNSRIFHKTDTNKLSETNTNKSIVNGKENVKRNSESDNSSVASESTVTASNENSAEGTTAVKDKRNSTDVKISECKPMEQNITKQIETHSIELNLDEIFKEPLPEISSNAENVESAGSKFTRWFKRDDSNTTGNIVADSASSASSFAGSFHPLVNSTSNIKNIVSSSSTENNSVPVPNLLDLLRGSQENTTTAMSKQDVRTLVSGKLHSLEEIEAKLRGTDMSKQAAMNALDRKKKEEETEAFKKLLSQAIKPNDATKKSNENLNYNDFELQKTKPENVQFRREKLMLSSLLCNGETHNFSPNMFSSQVPRMSPMNAGKQFHIPQNKQQQEMLSKMLISSTGNYSVPPPTTVRAMNSTITPGAFSHISPEIQSRVNDCQINRELMQRPETINILRALRNGELTIHQLIEQYKKTTPSQLKFRESVICVLKVIQQTPFVNSNPFMGSSMGMTFNIPPPPAPPHSPQAPYSENIIQQMMMNSQYRSGLPNIVYQRDFSVPSQNVYQNNTNKKHPTEQAQNMNQASIRMNSPITINAAPSVVTAIGNNSANASTNVGSLRENKSCPGMTLKLTPATQSHSFTPLSVLRKLSAEKENVDNFSKESKESKTDMLSVYSQSNNVNLQQTIVSSAFVPPVSNTVSWNNSKSMAGEKNVLVQYSSNTSSQSGNNICVNASLIEHLNNFGTCIPPPNVSGQYFVGNVIRPSNLSTQIPIFGNPSLPILSRLPISPNTNTFSKGIQKLPSNLSQLHQFQIRSISAQVPQGHDTYNISQMNRLPSDTITSSNCGSQNVPARNPYVNGLLSSGDEQLNRLFSNGNVNQSFPMSNANSSLSVQNIISVEEIERIQQSVRN